MLIQTILKNSENNPLVHIKYFALLYSENIYRTRAIITRGLYIFYPLFEGQKPFFKGLFS